MAGTFAATINESVEAAHRHERKRQHEERLAEPIHAIDRVIAELEDFHLKGRRVIPPSCQVRVRELAALHCLPMTVTRQVRITRLMDRLYTIQHELLSKRQAQSQLAEPRRVS